MGTRRALRTAGTLAPAAPLVRPARAHDDPVLPPVPPPVPPLDLGAMVGLPRVVGRGPALERLPPAQPATGAENVTVLAARLSLLFR